MRKFYIFMVLLHMAAIGLAQVEINPFPGSLETRSHEIVRPDLSGFTFNDILKNGNYQLNRALDYDSLNMTFLGNWPMGQSYTLAYSGIDNLFLVGAGGAVMIVDATEPASPEVISTVRARALVDAVFFDPETSRLYLGAYFSGVEIWDLADMQHPVFLHRIPTSSYPRGGVFASGDLVYVVTVANGIHIYDITDLNNVVHLGEYIIPTSTLVWDAAMDGNLIYCACSSGGCRIVDVSDPANPAIQGIAGGYTSGVCVEDNILYTVSGSTGLRVFDVNDPSNPQLLGSLSLEGSPENIEVQDGIAYVSNAYNPIGGVNIVDVSDPANPELLTKYGSYANHIAVHGNVVAFSGGGLGCTILDVADPENPLELSNMQLPWSVNEVCVSGNLAFTGSNGFRVFDVSDKSDPYQVGYDETQGSLVAAGTDLAVFIPKSMGGNNPVNIMDISDPENPYKRGHYMAPVMTYDIDLKGTSAFIACWWDGFRVVDFADPDAPTLAAHAFGWVNNNSVPGEEYCFVQALDTEGDYLFLIDYKPFEDQDTKGLYVFDISDPESPQFVSRYADLLSAGYDVDVVGDYAYVADREGGLEVIDVSDPFNPITTGYVYLPDVGYSVDVEGGFAYVASYILGGIQVVDVSNPSDPQIAGYYYRSGCFALGATVQGSYVFVGDGPAGFQIYDNLIITSVEEPTDITENACFIYPNPAHESVFIELDIEKPSLVNVEISDITGRRIKEIVVGNLPTGQHRIACNELPGKGVYLLQTVVNGKSETTKLIIQ
jgi:hypothetical protein